MNATICGHDRDVLLHVLNVAQGRNDLSSELNWSEVRDRFLSHLDRTIFDNWSLAAARASAWFDIHDPAKLAELLMEAARERGLHVYCIGNDGSLALIKVYLTEHLWRPFGLPQARTVLLLVLSLPSVATVDDAMKVFGAP